MAKITSKVSWNYSSDLKVQKDKQSKGKRAEVKKKVIKKASAKDTKEKPKRKL